jgi:acetyl-CoA C-acetyltransferase
MAPRPARQLRTAVVAARALASAIRRTAAPAQVPAEVDLPAPADAATFGRHVHATRVLEVDRTAAGSVLGDLARLADWATIHQSWRRGPDAATAAGDELVQIIRLMDIPAQVRWVVEPSDDDGFALLGTGPMGITLGLWGQVAALDAGRSVVRLDAGLDGSPLRGPVGATAVRSVEVALHESLERFAELAAGAVVLSVPSAPVVHTATGTALDPRTPVIVGVAQLTWRDPATEDDRAAREPAEMCAAAVRRAVADARAEVDLVALADAVHAVPSASWTYGDQARVVAERLGAGPVTSTLSSPYGGDGSQLLLNDAAERIARGEAQIVLLTGAEAGATVARLASSGDAPGWPSVDHEAVPDRRLGVDRSPNHEIETAVGLGAPIYVYALLEDAVRGELGLGVEQHLERVGGLWSRLSDVAATNPHAWDPTARSVAEIVTPGPRNRAVSSPYTKLMCANLQVDQATGIVMTSVGAANAAGIDQERWVFPQSGASATDEWFVAERADLTTSPAITAAGAAALADAGITVDRLGPVDLYACFPSAVQIGARSLGLPVDDPERPLSLTGGLTFGGGPGNNYGSHAVATLVERLRADPDAYGLSTSLGWYATKHAIGVYSARPPRQLFVHRRPRVARPAPRPVVQGLQGEGVVEAGTALEHRDGGIEAFVLSVVRDDGTRALLRVDDTARAAALAATDLVRRRVVGRADGTLDVVGTEREDLPAAPSPPVLDRVEDGVAVISLNRPEVRNAIDLRTATLLERAVDDAEADPDVRVVVLAGEGPTFCAGMDLVAAHRGEVPVTERRGPLGITRVPPTKPLVVAVEGDALAGGMEVALLADVLVAARGGRMGLPEVRRGLLAAAGGLWRAAERLPRNVALELAMTGEPCAVERLHELGLVNHLVEPGTALETALAIARTIAANAPLSVAASRRVVLEAPAWTAEEGFDRQTDLATPVVMSEDAREGVAAFAERREPRWTGR